MKKVINIAVDIETLSLHENAAIVSIGAVPFDKEKGIIEHIQKFYEAVNATTCAFSGMHFSEDTVKFWTEQSDEAKAALTNQTPVSIREALENFVNYVESISGPEDVEICIWAQGSDFDIPILRWGIRNVLQIKDVPWKHTQVRDARTYILEGIELVHGVLDKPYDVLTKNKDWVKHSSLADAMQLARNVTEVNRMLRDKLNNEQ